MISKLFHCPFALHDFTMALPQFKFHSSPLNTGFCIDSHLSSTSLYLSLVVQFLSCVQLFATWWTMAHQASLLLHYLLEYVSPRVFIMLGSGILAFVKYSLHLSCICSPMCSPMVKETHKHDCYGLNVCISSNSYVKTESPMWLYLEVGPLKGD